MPTENDFSFGERQQIDTSSISTHGRMGLCDREQYGDQLRNTSLTVGVVQRRKSTKLSELRHMHLVTCNDCV